MWVVWVPLVTAWLTLPYFALVRHGPWLHTPDFALTDPVYSALRWMAAAIGVICLLLTAWCWARMDANWSMAVSEAQRGELIADGLFARVRHPIYALSVMLMLCSAVIVATPPMLGVAVVHIALMHLKARNEERHMLKMHGAAYAAYLRRTGRFVPRLGAALGLMSSRRGAMLELRRLLAAAAVAAWCATPLTAAALTSVAVTDAANEDRILALEPRTHFRRGRP